MKLQGFERINQAIRDAFPEKKTNHPEQRRQRLKFSWSNWGFGLEDFDVSCARLEKAGIRYIELHGNHYGPDLGLSSRGDPRNPRGSWHRLRRCMRHVQRR